MFHLVTLITVIQETHQIDISTKVTSKEEIIMEAAAILGMKTALVADRNIIKQVPAENLDLDLEATGAVEISVKTAVDIMITNVEEKIIAVLQDMKDNLIIHLIQGRRRLRKTSLP